MLSSDSSAIYVRHVVCISSNLYTLVDYIERPFTLVDYTERPYTLVDYTERPYTLVDYTERPFTLVDYTERPFTGHHDKHRNGQNIFKREVQEKKKS